MNSFLQTILHRPVAVAMLFGALLLGGVFAFTRLPIELSPTVEFPSLSIHTSWGNTSPETVEMFLTAPIEEIANTILGVKKVSSRSREGRSVVNVEFEQATDMNFARLELYEKLSAFAETLPPGISAATIERYVPEDFRELQGFLTFAVAGKQSASSIRKYAEERIAPALRSIKGIAKVEVLGGEEREIQIELEQDRVKALGLSVQGVAASLNALEYSASAGVVNQSNGRVTVSVQNRHAHIANILAIPIHTMSNGRIVRLRDIGDVKDGIGELKSIYRVNGKPSVTLVIDKEPRINPIRVADEVFLKLRELANQFPESFELITVSDKSEQMRGELDSLYREIIVSLLCIWIVLLLFLGNSRAALIVLSSIFFSLAGTFLVFWFFGLSLHLLTLAGLVFGFGRVVDDSIVVLDNIQRHTSPEGTRQGGTTENIIRAVEQVRLPVIASTIATVGALVPIAFLPDDLKPYFLDFGIAVGVSLLMSLLVSFTFIPSVINGLSFSNSQTGRLMHLGSRLNRVYVHVLKLSLRFRKTVLCSLIFGLGIPFWLLPDRVESENTFAKVYNSIFANEVVVSIRPSLNYGLGGTSHLFFTKVTQGEVWDWGNETYLIVRVGFPQGTEIHRYDEVAAAIEREVRVQSQGVKKVTTRVVDDYASLKVDFDDSSAVTAIPYEMKNRLTVFAAQTGGATISVAGFGPGFYSGGESAPSFYVKVLGYNYNRVKEIAEQFKQKIERNPRIAEVDIDRSFGRWSRSTELVAKVNRDAIALHHLTVVDVIRWIRSLTRGAVDWNAISSHNERVPYVVKASGYDSFSVSDLQSSKIKNRNGELVALSDLIEIEERRVPSEITREDQQYVRWISFEYKGPYKYGDQFVDATIESMPLPSGYKFDRSFSFFFFSEKSKVSMLWLALVALVIVFMVTSSLYESFIRPFIVIVSIPLSLMGLFLAFYLTDTAFGRGGYASVMLLIGIVVANAIVLVDYVGKHFSAARPSTELLIQCASERLRPIMMTSLTTIGALVPLFLWSNATSVWYSLALGAIGGMVSSTLLTLVAIPILLSLQYRVRVTTAPISRMILR
jgi:HAE1 family hydrophobic/amphiphilic exporter-1